MFAVCTDALNPTARPTAAKLRKLSQFVGVRNVLFDDVRFYGYYHALYASVVPQTVVLAGESFSRGQYGTESYQYAKVLSPEPPTLWLIGNEANAQEAPEGVPSGSWIMTPDEYVLLWNESVAAIKSVIAHAPCFVGGMVGDVPSGESQGWIGDVLPRLDPRPDGIDIHYPVNEQTFVDWQGYGLPLSCMEWCYAGGDVSRDEVFSWLTIVNSYTVHNAWFCASEGQAETMGLWTAGGRERKAFNDLHAALLKLYGS